MRIATENLLKLRPGDELLWTHSSGLKHRAVVKKKVGQSWLLHVYFNESSPQTRRWSFDTNKPIGEFGRNYIGNVLLEGARESNRS